MILAVVVAVVAAAGIALAVGLAWRRSAQTRASFEAAYEQLPEPCAFAKFALAGGGAVAPEEIALALRLAMDCIDEHWPAGWPTAPVRGIRVLVRAEAEWVDAYGRRVAGLAYPAQGIMVVGSDLAALAHELAELLYWRLEGAEDWQAREWAGRAEVEAACSRYAERRRAA